MAAMMASWNDRLAGIMSRATYCGARPLALIAPAHFATSLSTNFARKACDRCSGSTGSMPTAFIPLCTFGASPARTVAAVTRPPLRARGAELHLGLVGLRIGDELLKVGCRQIVTGDQHEREVGEQRDRLEVLRR